MLRNYAEWGFWCIENMSWISVLKIPAFSSPFQFQKIIYGEYTRGDTLKNQQMSKCLELKHFRDFTQSWIVSVVT